MSTTIRLTIEVVESNGIIDRDAIRSALFCQLESKLDDQDTYKERVAQAVNGVFDNHAPGTRLLLDHLVSKSTEALSVQPEEYTTWKERVLDYVRSHSKGDDALFAMGKGSKNGGVARRAKPGVVVGVEVAPAPKSEPAEMAAE